MYMKPIIASLLFILLCCSTRAQRPAPDVLQTSLGGLSIQPLNHASLVLSLSNLTIYADPTAAADYTGIKAPDIILCYDRDGCG